MQETPELTCLRGLNVPLHTEQFPLREMQKVAEHLLHIERRTDRPRRVGGDPRTQRPRRGEGPLGRTHEYQLLRAGWRVPSTQDFHLKGGPPELRKPTRRVSVTPVRPQLSSSF